MATLLGSRAKRRKGWGGLDANTSSIPAMSRAVGVSSKSGTSAAIRVKGLVNLVKVPPRTRVKPRP